MARSRLKVHRSTARRARLAGRHRRRRTEFYRYYDQSLFPSLKLGSGMFFDRETFGQDRLVTGFGKIPHGEFFAKLRFPSKRAGYRAPLHGRSGLLARPDAGPETSRVGQNSYADFLARIVKVAPRCCRLPDRTHDLFVWALTRFPRSRASKRATTMAMVPGLYSMGWARMEIVASTNQILTFSTFRWQCFYCSLAGAVFYSGRMPGTPWKTWSWPSRLHVSTAIPPRAYPPEQHCRWSAARRRPQLGKRSGSNLRTQSATLSGARTRLRAGLLQRHGPLPLPQLPRRRKKRWLWVKTPLVYSHIALRNWLPFQKLGVHQIAARMLSPYAAIDFPVSIGEYKFPSRPEEPMVVFMVRTPCQPGLSERNSIALGGGALRHAL